MKKPSDRGSRINQDSGRAITIATLALGGIAALAAIAVVPEVRCWLHLDKCPATPNLDVVSNQQTGISGASDLKIGGDLSVQNVAEGTSATKTSQTGISASGPVTINGSVTIGNTIGNAAEQDCSKPYLQMQLDDRTGTLVMSPDDEEGLHPRRFRLIVGNPTKDCTAVVKSVFLKVEDVVEDHHPALEALTACYSLRADLSPTDKGKTIILSDRSYNYTPLGAPDQFVADVFTKKRGFAYGVRFGVEWTDLKTQKTNETLSWVALAAFPDGQGEIFGGASAFEWRKEQLKNWRRQYDNTKQAIDDASKRDAPYKRQFDLKCSPG